MKQTQHNKSNGQSLKRKPANPEPVLHIFSVPNEEVHLSRLQQSCSLELRMWDTYKHIHTHIYICRFADLVLEAGKIASALVALAKMPGGRGLEVRFRRLKFDSTSKAEC